jgi:hypothetical protein
MNEYLTKALSRLEVEEIKMIIDWLLREKERVYSGILSDEDCYNNLILLNPLEEKLGLILVNLVQKRHIEEIKSK